MEREMYHRVPIVRRAAGALACSVLVLLSILIPNHAIAGLILGAELRFTYEDNVVGLLSDQQQGKGGGPGGAGMPGTAMAPAAMGGGGMNRYTGSGSAPGQSPGDLSTTLSAEAGGYVDGAKDATFYAKGFASRTEYNTYTDLNATIGGVRAGMLMSLSDSVTANIALTGKLKRFRDSQRDSTAYAADAGLKEKLGPQFFLRETVEYEKNNADAASFSYTGTTADVGAGFKADKTTTVTAGGRFLRERYELPSGAKIDTRTFYAGLEHALAKTWTISGEYELQVSKVSATGTSTTDNILSLAVRYSY